MQVILPCLKNKVIISLPHLDNTVCTGTQQLMTPVDFEVEKPILDNVVDTVQRVCRRTSGTVTISAQQFHVCYFSHKIVFGKRAERCPCFFVVSKLTGRGDDGKIRDGNVKVA